jgi:REP element-mobilizing transposase RayT
MKSPHHRRSIRRPGYDHSQPGAYFVTICTRNRECVLGEAVEGEVRLNEAGRVVSDTWNWLGRQYPYVEPDEWVIMPNHLHAIVIIHANPSDEPSRGGSRTAPTLPRRKPLGLSIGALKTVSAKRINELRGTPGAAVWQRNYFEHVLRDEEDLRRIREYIAHNPLSSEIDEENPGRVS